MPMSNPVHIPAVIHFAFGLQPQRVLDIGVGMGCYGMLLRQYLDIGKERISKEEWQLKIDGLEVFEPYRNPIWEWAYSRIQMGDLRTADLSGSYDMILCNDVLEHLEIEEVRTLVPKLLSAGKVLIVTTPAGEYPQGAWGGNEAEIHRSIIVKNDLAGCVVAIPCGSTICYVCSANGDAAREIRKLARSCPRFYSENSSRLRRYIPSSLKRIIRRHILPV